MIANRKDLEDLEEALKKYSTYERFLKDVMLETDEFETEEKDDKSIRQLIARFYNLKK